MYILILRNIRRFRIISVVLPGVSIKDNINFVCAAIMCFVKLLLLAQKSIKKFAVGLRIRSKTKCDITLCPRIPHKSLIYCQFYFPLSFGGYIYFNVHIMLMPLPKVNVHTTHTHTHTKLLRERKKSIVLSIGLLAFDFRFC